MRPRNLSCRRGSRNPIMQCIKLLAVRSRVFSPLDYGPIVPAARGSSRGSPAGGASGPFLFARREGRQPGGRRRGPFPGPPSPAAFRPAGGRSRSVVKDLRAPGSSA